MLIPRPRYLGKHVWSHLFASSGVINNLVEIADQYGISSFCQVMAIHTGDNSRVNVVTDQDRRKWVLKQYEDVLSEAAILFNNSVMRHLNSAGFPVPHIRMTSSGQDFLSLGGKNFALYEFIPGFRYNDFLVIPRSKRQHYIQQAGNTLARCHKIMAGASPCGHKNEGYQSINTSKRWDEYSWHYDEWNRLISIATHPRNGNKLLTEKRAQIISEMLSNVVEHEKNRQVLPITVIHGDFSPLNLLYSPDGSVQALLDFDKACFEESIDEVATSLLEFAGRTGGSINWKDASVFLTGYLQVNPLTSNEIMQLPYVLRRNKLKLLVWMLRKYAQNKSNSARILSVSTLDCLDWLDGNGEEHLQDFLRLHCPV